MENSLGKHSNDMEKYKELIEKEAEKLAPIEMDSFYDEPLWDINEKERHGFITAINSDLNAKLIEIEKRKYTLGLLNELKALVEWENGKLYHKLTTDIITLEQEINQLENELK